MIDYMYGEAITDLFLSGPIPPLNVRCLSVRRGTGWLGVIPISDEMQDSDSGEMLRKGLDPLDSHDRSQFEGRFDDQVLPKDLSKKEHRR
jgi:hypothetical protein